MLNGIDDIDALLLSIFSDSQNVGGSKTKQSRLETLLPPSSSSLANIEKDYTDDDAAAVFSSQKSQFADYTTWKGIENKTGIEQKDAVSFLVKELLDNAFDYFETLTTQHHNNNNAIDVKPEIRVIIEKSQGKYIRIIVSNSNIDQKKAAFSKETLKSIFDFDRYHSSKRNQFKITKGALGDALKEVLCIPYVLARDAGMADNDSRNYPLYIISQHVRMVKA